MRCGDAQHVGAGSLSWTEWRGLNVRRLMFSLVSHIALGADKVIALSVRMLSEIRYRCFRYFGFKPRSDDIYVVSYPKAGTTVMQVIVHAICRGPETPFEHIDDVVPWLEAKYLHVPELAERLSSPRMFKTHRDLGSLPASGLFIYLVRDPKDTCVSFYFHLMSGSVAKIPLGQFVDRFVRGRLGAGSWAAHLHRSGRGLQERRVLVVHYEDIVDDMAGVVDRVCAFFGKNPDLPTRRLIVERCGFSYMKARNEQFDPLNAWGTLRPMRAPFIRRGQPHDWTNYLTPAQAHRIDDYAKRVAGKVSPRVRCVDDANSAGAVNDVRGTLLIRLDIRSDISFLYKSERDGVPWGLRFPRTSQPLARGDHVRLLFHLDRRTELAFDRCEIFADDTATMSAALCPRSEESLSILQSFARGHRRAIEAPPGVGRRDA